jgi:hypothetical protein
MARSTQQRHRFTAALAGSIALVLCLGAEAPGTATAEEQVAGAQTGDRSNDEASKEKRLEAVERAVEVLAEEQDRLRTVFAVPEEGLQSAYGLGPAASKVYSKEHGLSIGGYGEWRGRFLVADNPEDEHDQLDQLRAVLYTGYKFTDWLVFNSEVEFEHGSTEGAGAVSVEFLTLDFLLHPAANLRAGLLLIPMGFLNEIHEPVFYYGVERPEVERRILPSTWRENGAGLFGELCDRLSYRLYVVNGFRASGFEDSGFREGKQDGSEALADHFAFVGRADLRVIEGMTLGGSVYAGKTGQNETITREVGGTDQDFDIPDAMALIWEVHAELKRYGASLRGLYAHSHLQNAGRLSRALGLGMRESVAKEMEGGYVEIGYDVLPLLLPETRMSLEPFYRFEHLDTQDEVADGFRRNRNLSRDFHVVGLQFKPHPQVVVKLDYRNIAAQGGHVADEVQVGLGYVF